MAIIALLIVGSSPSLFASYTVLDQHAPLPEPAPTPEQSTPPFVLEHLAPGHVESSILGGEIENAGQEALHHGLEMEESEEAADARHLAYLSQHGVRLSPPDSKVRIVTAASGERSLVAAADVAAGELLASVPYEAGLSLEPSDAPPYEGAGAIHCLAAKLLCEVAKGNGSAYWPYLATLPRWAPVPWYVLSAERGEFAAIQYEPTARRMSDFLRLQVDGYERAARAAALAGATWGEFAWAVAIATCHGVTVPLPPSTEPGAAPAAAAAREFRSVLLPVADLLSHDFNENVASWRERGVRRDALELFAARAVRGGELLTSAYGALPTEYYFMFHAFVPERNPHDSALLFYSLHEAVHWFLRRHHPELSGKGKWKNKLSKPEFERFVQLAKRGAARYLREVGREDEAASDFEPRFIDPQDDSHGRALHVFADGSVDARLLGGFAGVQLELDGFTDVARGSDWRNTVSEVYATVRRRCTELLLSYPTTAEQDAATLRQERRAEDPACDGSPSCEKMGVPMQLVVQYRLQKKLFLETIVNMYQGDDGDRLHQARVHEEL